MGPAGFGARGASGQPCNEPVNLRRHVLPCSPRDEVRSSLQAQRRGWPRLGGQPGGEGGDEVGQHDDGEDHKGHPSCQDLSGRQRRLVGGHDSDEDGHRVAGDEGLGGPR